MKTKTPLPEVGSTIEVPYPFVHDSYTEYDEDCSAELACWKPGIRMEPHHDDADAVADGMGKQLITVIGIYKPGRFPTRVFFTRKWMDPRGLVFGKDACRITTVNAFQGLIRGYRHEFELREAPLREGRVEKGGAR